MPLSGEWRISHEETFAEQQGEERHKQFSLCAQLQGASVEHRPQNGQHSQKLHAAYDADGHMVPFSLYRNPHPVGQEPGRRPQQKGQDITHEKRSHEGQQIFKSCIHRSRGSCYN